MTFCPFCGRQLQDGETCDCQTKQQNTVANTQTTGTAYATSNGKLFSILAYLGILWVIGLFVDPEKNDPKVKFHVGQGIILTIANVALNVVSAILGMFMPSFIMVILNMAIWAFSIIFMIMGIINANHGEEKELPVIGQFAFYK